MIGYAKYLLHRFRAMAFGRLKRVPPELFAVLPSLRRGRNKVPGDSFGDRLLVTESRAAERVLGTEGLVVLKHAIPLPALLPYMTSAVEEFIRKAPTFSARCGIVIGNRVEESEVGGHEVTVNLEFLSMLCRSKAGIAARNYLCSLAKVPEVLIPVTAMQVRRRDPSDDAKFALPFHQDGVALPPSWPSVNLWTLLYPESCGACASGLEFIPGALRELVERTTNPTHPTYGFLEPNDVELTRLIDRYGTWNPQIEFGDVLLFDGATMHRTGVGQFGKTRISSETRFLPATPEIQSMYESSGQPVYRFDGVRLRGPASVMIHRDSAPKGEGFMSIDL